MSDETLELFIQQYIAGVAGEEVVFSWQGGEPTLLGPEFFRKVVAFDKKHAKPRGSGSKTICRPTERCSTRSGVSSSRPIVEHKTFERTAPQTWNNAALPKDGDLEGGRAIRTRLSRNGRWIPMIGDIFFAGCLTGGWIGMWAR